MAQHKSAIKAHNQSLKRALRNKSTLSKIKTFTKKLVSFISLGNYEDAKHFLGRVESLIMKSVTKKVLKLNTAARKVSKLTKKVKTIEPKIIVKS